MSTLPVTLGRTRRSVAVRAVVAGAVATVGALLIAFIASNVVAFTGQRSLAARWDNALANPAAHANPIPGDPVARIRIPLTGLDAIVVEGGAPSRAPLHLPKTALPGFPGLAAIESGRLGFGSFFSTIDRLQPGDEIFVQSLRGVVRYRVTDVQRLDPAAIDFTDGGDATTIALVAPASRLAGSERIVVRARAAAEISS
ncbi:MAG: sortase [Actinomycetota bacterium]|nr:sortase [Actinomycetota bacterium]